MERLKTERLMAFSVLDEHEKNIVKRQDEDKYDPVFRTRLGKNAECVLSKSPRLDYNTMK